MGDLISSLSPTLMVIVPQNNFLKKTYIFPYFHHFHGLYLLRPLLWPLHILKSRPPMPNIKMNHIKAIHTTSFIMTNWTIATSILRHPIITILTFSYYSCPALKDILIWLFEGYLDYVSHAWVVFCRVGVSVRSQITAFPPTMRHLATFTQFEGRNYLIKLP